MNIINKTPFKALAVPAVCQNDNNHLVVVVKGTFSLSEKTSASLKIADEQLALFCADEHWDEPDKSSVRYESDLAIVKRGVDVILNGTAYSQSRQVSSLDVTLSVANHKKTIRVFGNRYWEKTNVGFVKTTPEYFESISLKYENAYGGVDEFHQNSKVPGIDQRNPVGKGFVISPGSEQLHGLALPNLENPDQLITNWRDRPVPAGFGSIARNWAPRHLMAGTYDAAWQKKRAPLLPKDFNEQYYSAASNGMILNHKLVGEAPVSVVNASELGTVKFKLPDININVERSVESTTTIAPAYLDTVIIEPDEKRVVLTWRSAAVCHWNLARINWVKITTGVKRA